MKNENFTIALEIFLEAILSPWRAKLRSSLAILGIVIGAASITTMLSTGHMAERETLREFEQMGVRVFVINAVGGSSANLMSSQPIKMAHINGIGEHELETLERRVPGIELISPLKVYQTSASLTAQSQEMGVAAAQPLIRELAHLNVKEGRFFSDIDNHNMVVVLGADAANNIRRDSDGSLIGKQIRIGNYVFTIIGVLSNAHNGAYNPIDFDKAALIPLGVSDRAIGIKPLNTAMGLIRQGESTDLISTRIKEFFQQLTPPEFVEFQSPNQLIKALKAQRELQTRLLAATSAISLIVGGVGIMNVMLMNVLERRREIGLRASIGATPRQIQLMFLIESSVLSGMGGFCGCSLGVIISVGFAMHSGWQIDVPTYVLPISLGLTIFLGMVFGSYPAIQASQLNPVEALKYE